MSKINRGNQNYYRVFTLLGILVILVGVLMNVSDFKAPYDISPKYSPSETADFTGKEVILLGAIILGVVLIYYLYSKNKISSKF